MLVGAFLLLGGQCVRLDSEIILFINYHLDNNLRCVS